MPCKAKEEREKLKSVSSAMLRLLLGERQISL
jgi:hypothetical protein